MNLTTAGLNRLCLKRTFLLIVLVFTAAAIKIFSLYSGAVERYYSTGIYPFIAGLQRLLFGWIPFSIGDIFYGIAIIWIIIQIIKVINV